MRDRKLRLAHAVPGRVQFTLDGLKGNRSLAEELEQKFRGLESISGAEVSHLTGSIVLVYEPGTADPLALRPSLAESIGLPLGAETESLKADLNEARARVSCLERTLAEANTRISALEQELAHTNANASSASEICAQVLAVVNIMSQNAEGVRRQALRRKSPEPVQKTEQAGGE